MNCVSDLCGISYSAKIYESREEDFRGRRMLIPFEEEMHYCENEAVKDDDYLQFINDARM